MKLVSLKTLLASLLGLVTAFSWKAYDEDVKQAQQGKALYRDLFGKFAYVAAHCGFFISFSQIVPFKCRLHYHLLKGEVPR